MQKGAHCTFVCATLLMGFKKTYQRTMYVNPYNKIVYDSE